MPNPRALIATWLKAASAFAKNSKATAVALVIGIGVLGRIVLIQLRCLPLPLVVEESHHWRQAFTYGVAWNYAHGGRAGWDFFHPHWYVEGALSNLVAMEAPVYPYLGGLVMRLTGDGPFFMRLLSWLALVATVVVLFIWLGQNRRRPVEAWSDRAGLFVAAGLSISLASDFRSIQPDAPAAGLAILAAFFFARYAEKARPRDVVIAALLTTLSILTKPVALGVVPALGLFGVWRRERWIRHALIVGGALALAVLPHFFWDRWALKLLEQTGGGIVISIQHDPKEMLAHLKNPNILREGVLQLLPSYAASWWLVPAILAGIYRAVAEPRLQRFGVPFLVWLVGYMTELLAFGDRLHSNYYYYVLGPAPLAFFAALGLGSLVSVLDAPRPRPSIVTYRAAGITAVTAAGTLFAQTAQWNSVDQSALGFAKTWRVWTDDIGLARLLLAVVLVFAVAPLLRRLRIPTWAGPLLVIAFFWTGIPAAQNTWQFLRFYSAVTKRPSTAGVPELQAAIDRHSTVADRILSSEPEPIWFHYARRNGFPLAMPTPAQVANLRPRGARLYVHFKPTPAPSPPGRLLASGTSWYLYCVAADDCPTR